MASKELADSVRQTYGYGSRYGNKDGKNKKDLMKVIHYAMLLLHLIITMANHLCHQEILNKCLNNYDNEFK